MGRLLLGSGRQIGGLAAGDIRDMRLFRQIADAGGITAAVERFDLEKTALSRAVSALEQRLDGTLCIRGPKGFSLTPYGQEVYAAICGIEDALDTARARINGAYRDFQGEVRLGITDSCLTNEDAKISDAIEVFMQMAPAVRLSVSIHPPDQLAAALESRELHLGIVSADHSGPALASTPIFTETANLYCCPRADETPPQLAQLSGRGYGVVLRRFRNVGPALSSRHIAAAWTVEASGLEAVATLLNTGRCVGFMPDHYVTGTRTRRPFVIVPGSDALRLVTVFSVLTEKGRIVSQAVAALRDTLIKTARFSA
ncbi:LysR family transcriptional regulator [Acidisoma silvae]|uniref:LysR family transcriptional regulator n=1 Tax=Acidisoma silvae TaxID=2802396 RepID=A0A963YV95_9PROT|nr:LysR family transcriptional regulator [Acidisoma silvae]MCB8877040.1 LysR family transcriptional regulator [Acidisoma silvae]